MTYIDATNLTRRDRRPFIELARKHGCEIEALFFDIPLEICKARNASRARAGSGSRAGPDGGETRAACPLKKASAGSKSFDTFPENIGGVSRLSTI